MVGCSAPELGIIVPAMDDLLAARSQMAVSLAFHILFAIAGMAMPVLMTLAQWQHRRSGDAALLELAHRWAKGTAILFAVGAVSGTVLSFELGLLWPEFMRHAGPLIGMPFSLEGFAFFLEAIFLGLYLYGWDKLPPRVHLACGVGVAICGLASAVFVTAVNAWMNEPVGFERDASGGFVVVDPWAPFQSEAFVSQAIHTALSAYCAVAIAVLGIHAWALRRDPSSALHRAAFKLALALALVSVPAQLLSGDLAAKHVARNQPAKLAAAESLFVTQTRAPLAIGGWPDPDAQRLRGAIELPGGLSFLAFADFDAEVTGLDRVPREDWPPVRIVHVAFQLMVGCGVAMLGVALLGGWLWWRGAAPWASRRYQTLAMLVAPLGLVAVEAGWVVTEVGRQPWIIHGQMRTAAAVTSMPQLALPFSLFTGLYVFLGVMVVVMLRNHVVASEAGHAASSDASMAGGEAP
jgi:cytochrome d ubiquinol oxidase subunit I